MNSNEILHHDSAGIDSTMGLIDYSEDDSGLTTPFPSISSVFLAIAATPIAERG
jgi:hypothetical protein